MIAGGMPTRVYYVSHGGFDTHNQQVNSHDRLLGQLDSGLKSFFADLKEQGNDKRVVLMTFSEPIPFDSIDNQPVDLLFALLVPESECKQHLKTLSLMASKLGDKAVCRQLRQATSDEELYQIMTSA